MFVEKSEYLLLIYQIWLFEGNPLVQETSLDSPDKMNIVRLVCDVAKTRTAKTL